MGSAHAKKFGQSSLWLPGHSVEQGYAALLRLFDFLKKKTAFLDYWNRESLDLKESVKGNVGITISMQF